MYWKKARLIRNYSVKVGDLVLVSRRASYNYSLGVVIEGASVGDRYIKALLYHGHVEIHSEQAVEFQYPGWAYLPKIQEKIDYTQPPGLLAPTIQKTKELGFSPSIVGHLGKFEAIASKKYQYYRFGAKALYESLVSEEVKQKTLIELTSQILQKSPNPTDLVGAFNAFKGGLYFQLPHTYNPTNPEFLINSWDTFVLYDAMLKHVKTKSPEALAFFEQMQHVIESSRQGVRTHVKLTLFGKELIKLLKECIGRDTEFHRTIATLVLKNVKVYGQYPRLPVDLVRFLKETGVWYRSEDYSLYFHNARGSLDWLEGVSKVGSEAVSEANYFSHLLSSAGPFDYNSETNWGEKGMPTTPKIHGPEFSTEYKDFKSNVIDPKGIEEFHQKDTLVALREEVHETVFTIDDPTAHELDDGISVQTIDGREWIHVHIADPTAYIPPSSPLAKLAQLRASSIYLPFRHFPMMPDALSDKIFNLGVSPTAMTFSATLNSDGSIADYKITPTILRNVKLTTYDDVDTILDWKPFIEKDPPFWVKEYLDKPRPRMPLAFTKEQSNELHKLQNLLLTHRQHRIDNNAIVHDQFSSSIRVLEYPLALSPLSPSSTFGTTEPVSNIKLDPYQLSQRSPAHTLVSEAMILAGRVASKYCQDHNIPVAYRGQASILEGIEAKHGNVDTSKIRTMIDNAMSSRNPETQLIPERQANAMLSFMQRASHSLDPIPHFSMGIGNDGEFTGYVKVTSPLRRYQDMLVHWQLQATLLGQKPVFDKEMVSTITKRMEAVARVQKILSRKSTRVWMLEYIKRKCLETTNDDLIAKFRENMPFDFHYDMNPDQKVYLGYAKYKKDSNDRDRMFVQIPMFGGLGGSCLIKDGSAKDELVRVVVQEVSPDKGYVLFKQV